MTLIESYPILCSYERKKILNFVKCIDRRALPEAPVKSLIRESVSLNILLPFMALKYGGLLL